MPGGRKPNPPRDKLAELILGVRAYRQLTQDSLQREVERILGRMISRDYIYRLEAGVLMWPEHDVIGAIAGLSQGDDKEFYTALAQRQGGRPKPGGLPVGRSLTKASSQVLLTAEDLLFLVEVVKTTQTLSWESARELIKTRRQG